MKNDLDISMLLRAFEIISESGEKTELGHRLDGVEAYTDYDGYTVFMSGNGVELSIGFHNTYNLDYEHEHLKDTFLKKLDGIIAEHA